jgi:hypothetical protein
MTPAETAARDAFASQAQACRERGSPFTGLLCEVLGRILERSTGVGSRVLDWSGRPDARGDSVPLRVAAGLHALVRRGRLPRLAALYPPHALPERETIEPVLVQALTEAEAGLLPWLDRPPQTNEPMRSAPLMAGLLVVAAETGGLPFALHELGTSAGLLLMLDRYEHRLGGVMAGTPGTQVRIEPWWEGGAPPRAAPVRVVRRWGCDLDPLDVTNDADRERLLAYVWPDQRDRFARAEAAIGIAAASPPRLDRAEAATWVETMLDPALAEPGIARVLMHAVALQYAPEEVVSRIVAHAARVGAVATDRSPFAWLRFEADPDYGERASLRLTLWPTGRERVLALGDTHCERLQWIR